jgi:cobalt-zinc-cadmium resistance protein CzcA
MLDRIILFSLRNKLVIGILTIGLIVWGSYSLTQLPIDAVPDITNNQVQVITYSPALSAPDIERLITFPIEMSLASLPHRVEMRSFSRFGLSVVTIVFEEHADIYWARQQVTERLKQAEREIPPGLGAPELAPITTGLGEIYQYVLRVSPDYAQSYSLTDLRSIQDWIVRRQILGIPGVADVSSFGGFVKQYEIALRPEKLRALNISMQEIFSAVERNNQNTGSAYIEKHSSAYFIRSEGMAESTSALGAIVVKTLPTGIPILIRDVAIVGYGAPVRYGAMTYSAHGVPPSECVGGLVMMMKGANSSTVISAVKERVAEINAALPKGIVIEPYLDRTKLVNGAIATVRTNLIEGALIVLGVLVLMLGSLRAGFLVASTIPLAMLFALGMMNMMGVSGNLMSLGAIDFGIIVDGAVIIVEATLHHIMVSGVMRNKTRLTQGEMDEEVYRSASAIRSSAAFGEIIILIVYVPILALSGVEGKMFKPMAQTVGFAILGAFFLSITYIPMMSSLVLSKTGGATSRFGLFFERLSQTIMRYAQSVYEPVLRHALRYHLLVMTASVVALAGSVVLFFSLGGEFIPTLDEGDFAVGMRVMTGSSLSHTIATSEKAGALLLENFPEVIKTVGKIGTSEIPTDPMPIEAYDLMVILKPHSEWTSAQSMEELAEKMQSVLRNIIGAESEFLQPIQMRFNELISGARQDVVVKIFGEDLSVLAESATRIAGIAERVEGVQDMYVEQVEGLQQIVVRIKREELARFGLAVDDVNTALRTGFAGALAGHIYENERRYEVVVRIDSTMRHDIEAVRSIPVRVHSGALIPLEQVADVIYEVGTNQIQREDAKRRIIVGFNVRNRDVESVVHDLQKALQNSVTLPSGYFVRYGGSFENLIEAKKRLSIAVPVSLLFIFVLLYFTFRSLKYGILIFSAIPLSAIGGIVALAVLRMPFSISAGVGFIALFGVAVLNGIVLITYFNRLQKERYATQPTDPHALRLWLTDIVLYGTAERLRPVLMTALVASLGFLPMALSTSSGAEVQRPLATVVIGGLVSATLLTLIVLPVVYVAVEKWSIHRASASEVYPQDEEAV